MAFNEQKYCPKFNLDEENLTTLISFRGRFFCTFAAQENLIMSSLIFCGLTFDFLSSTKVHLQITLAN